MRNLAILATILALSTAVDAKPHHTHHAKRAPSPARLESQQWVRDCVHERTGPTDGLELADATRLCRALRRIHDAVEACEEAVANICVANAKPDGSTDCEDDALAAEFATTCFPKPDRVAKEVK